MKHNLKIFFIALLIGMAVALIYAYKFDNTITSLAIGNKATIFYVGAYNNLEEANKKKSSYNSAMIYNDNGIYKVVIGVFIEQESIELMQSFFNDAGITFNMDQIKVSSEFKKLSSSYELLLKTSSKDMYQSVNNSLLKLFNEYKN